MSLALADIVSRIDTLSLQQGATLTRALVVFNLTDKTGDGRVRFAATFPMRREACPLPVTVRNTDGNIVPSRLTRSEISESADLPPGRVLWAMELEFVTGQISPQGWRTFAATFGYSPESQSDNEALFQSIPLLDVPVIETECHPGDLPLAGVIQAIDGLQ